MINFVILDRDGVINQDSADYIKTPDEWVPVPGSLRAITLLNQNDIPVFVATNQAGIARGKLDMASLEAIHEKMRAAVSEAGGDIRDIRFCPHHPEDDCHCRKPKPGLLLQLAEAHNLDLAKGCYVGDSLKDLRAAEAAGCTFALVLTGNGKETHKVRPHHPLVFDNLLTFAQHLISA